MLNRKFKSARISGIMLMAVASGIALPSQQSNAAILAAATGIGWLSLAGLGATVGGLGVGIAVPYEERTGAVRAFVGGLILLGIILPSDSDQYRFAPLRTREQLGRLGVTDQQARAYNRDLPRINAISQQVQGDLMASNHSGAEQSALIEFARQRWVQFLSALSPDTQIVLHKIISSRAR